MRVTIDTQRDDPAHIRQAINLLKSIVGDVPVAQPQNIFDSPVSGESAAPAPALFSMFDSGPSSPAPSTPVPVPQASSSEPEPDLPKLELY